jgi:hypothetical protein
MIREILTDPTVLGFIILAIAYAFVQLTRVMAERNPEQDAWDELYAVSGRVVAWIEQTIRKNKGAKLSNDDKAQLKSIAIDETLKQLNPKIEKEIMRNKNSKNVFKQILGTVIDHQVTKLKKKI